MKVQIVSDLHIERFKSNVDLTEFINPKGDILIMAGDIGSMYMNDQLCDFLHQACENFPIVIFIPGNHEYYRLHKTKPLSFFTLEKNMCKFKLSHKNFYFLNRATLQIGNWLIIGSTLWSNTCIFSKKIVKIHGFTLEKFLINHKLDKKFIIKQLKSAKKNKLNTLVVTHYPPIINAVHPKRRDDKFIDLYANNLYSLLKNANIWVSGHTHYNYNIYENGCLLISNQLGKIKDNIKNYSKEMILNI
jgi:predicted phosphodiesterase